MNNQFAIETQETYQKDLPLLQEIYQKLVQDNPDILFILRLHPEFINDISHSEFKYLADAPNVYMSTLDGNLPVISDSVNIADINIGYESTTAMESWLLNKLTIFVNPTRSDFERETHYLGCLVLKTYEELKDTVKAYYNGETNEAYEALSHKRAEILKDTIGDTDGQNYKRAAKIIMQQLPQAKRVPRYKMLKAFFKKEIIIQTFRFYLWQWDFYFKIRKGLKRPAVLYPYKKDKMETYEKMYSNINYD